MSARPPRPAEPEVIKGPWSDLPDDPAAPTPRREPWLRRRKAGATRREPFIRNWKGLAIILFLLFVAPPLCGWISRLVLSAMAGH